MRWKTWIYVAYLVLLIEFRPALGSSTFLESHPPNIIFLLADDLGWNDLVCYGSDLHETPRIDQLASQGMRFTRAYAMSVCSPTLAGILTGKHPARIHHTTWREAAISLQSRIAPSNQKLLPPVPSIDLAQNETTLAERLQALGFRTYHIGKWHLGDAAIYPEAHGFDENIGGTLWGAPQTYHHPFRGSQRFDGEFRYVPGLGVGAPGDYLTDRLRNWP